MALWVQVYSLKSLGNRGRNNRILPSSFPTNKKVLFSLLASRMERLNLRKLKLWRLKEYNKGYRSATNLLTLEINKINKEYERSLKSIIKTTKRKNDVLDRKIDENYEAEKVYIQKLYRLQWYFNHLKLEDHKSTKLKNSLLNKSGALKDQSIRLIDFEKEFKKEFPR